MIDRVLSRVEFEKLSGLVKEARKAAEAAAAIPDCDRAIIATTRAHYEALLQSYRYAVAHR